MTSPIDLVLSRLEKVRQRQSNQWSARCPAHNDKSPSFSVAEKDDGSVRFRCWTGCTYEEVIQALGLNPSDLYPPKNLSGKEPKRPQRLLTSSQALEMLEIESQIILFIGTNICNGKTPSQKDLDRCIKAASRILYLRDECMRYPR
jgi:hypothetical protein